MSLREETIELGDAFDRLDEELDDVVEQWQDADANTVGAQALQEEANELETALSGVAWLIEEHGDLAEVTIAGLDAGQFARIEDRASAMRAQASEPGGLPGATRNVRAAMALQESPFLDDGDADDLDACIQALTDGKPVGVVRWVARESDRLTTVAEGNYKPVSERLADSLET